MDDVKKYDKSSNLFADIPKPVAQVLLHKFTDLLSEDFTTLMKYDKLEVPKGIPATGRLKQGEDKTEDQEKEMNDEERYLKELENEQIDRDRIEVQREKFSNKATPQKGQLQEENNDSEEEPEEEEGWENRLRPRKKGVGFK
jgi:hypothetical protein